MESTLDPGAIKDLTKEIKTLNETIGSSKGSSWSSKGSESIIDAAAKKNPILATVTTAAKALSSFASTVLNVTNDLYKAGITQTSGYSEERVLGGQKTLTMLSQLAKLDFSSMSELYNQILYQLQDEAKLRTKINEEIGLTGELSEDVRRSIINASPAVAQMGFDMEKLSEFYTQMIEKSGRFNIINKEILERTAQVSRAFVGDLSQMPEIMSNFEKIGFGASDTLEYINESGKRSMELGVRSRRIIADMTRDLERLNQFGFKNGVQGLMEMEKRAIEFRTSITEVFNLADKLFDPDKAIELSANLSIIGGELGAFRDPLKLMYMAVNDVGGLQDALIGAAKGLATYNTEQGRFEITGINLRKAKAMAEALNIDYKEFTKSAIAGAERAQATMALLSTGLKMSDDDREFITNMSQMEKGEMVIRIPESLAEKLTKDMGQKIETAIPLSAMTDSLRKELIDNKNAIKGMEAKDIAMEQLNVQGKIERNLMAIAAVAKIRLSQVLKDTTVPLSTKMEATAGLLGKTVDELTTTKGGKLDLLPGTEKFITDLGKKMNMGGIVGMEETQRSVARFLKNVKTVKDAESESKKTVIENRFTFGSSSLYDGLTRFIYRNPDTWGDLYGINRNDRRSFLYNSGRGF